MDVFLASSVVFHRPECHYGVILCLKGDVERHALFKTSCNNNNVYDDGEVMNNGEVGRTGCQFPQTDYVFLMITSILPCMMMK